MPIDTSIIGRLMPAQFKMADPLDTAHKSLALQSLMGQREAQDMQLQQARQGMERNTRLQSLLGSNPEDLEGSLRSGGFLDESLKVGKDRRENKKIEADTAKSAADAAKTQFDMNMKRLEHGTAVLGTVKDQGTYDQAKSIMAQSFGPESVAGFPAAYDPSFVQQSIARGITRAQQMEDQRKAEAQAEVGRHNLKTEENAAGQLKVSQGQLGVAQGNLAVSRDRLRMDQSAPKGVYDPERAVLVDPRNGQATPVTMGGQPIGPKEKLTDAQKKELSSIDSQQNILRGALAEVEKTPGAFGTMRGLATMAGAIPESMAGKMDSPDQREARSYVFNVVSKVINERAGAAQSAQELARLRSFLPAETDNAAQIKDKLNSFSTYLENSRAGYDRAQGVNAQPRQQPTSSGPRVPKIAGDAEYNALPSGATFVGPDGVTRRKP